MESTHSHHRHFKISNEEEEDDDEQRSQDNDEMSTVRFYDCVFCRRGFTSAQALGGHMNIHRKDRTSSCRKTNEDNQALDHHIRSYSAFNLSHSSEFSFPLEPSRNNHQKCSSGFTSTGNPPRHVLFFIEKGRSQGFNHGEGDQELDLELRLGHKP
ncbi:hypothetical protein Nepgr_022720 [Nepenthes gracilis]|uniref:C2H2-type domain-containing protein n=1 Tax=Nepenthes gracilis TaxID=150966 RepID=A0AAD3XX97_NEPGR|nr:hypothetical protein Nepgr_022720 [Nepenthes gracilis]